MTINPETSILPPELVSGYVYNRILRVIGDQSYDQDRFPDGLPAEGTVTFKPKTAVRQVASDGKGTTLTREPVICTIYDGYDDPSQAGELVDEAGHIGGVWLAEGAYTVSYQFTDRYSNAPDIDIIVTDEYTEDNPLDVALQAGLTPSPTIKFVVNEQIYLDSLKARNEAEQFRDEAEGYSDGIASIIQDPNNIVVDTSVGTRVFVGDTMIYGDTGWRNIRDLCSTVRWDVTAGLPISLIRRVNDQVFFKFRFRAPENVVGTTSSVTLMDYTIPNGFTEIPTSFGPFGQYITAASHIYLSNEASRSHLTVRAISQWRDTNYSPSGWYHTTSSWPTSLPGTPA